jgi:hypothetical protein
MLDDVLTIKKDAAPLPLAKESVDAVPRAGEMSAVKMEGQWRIGRSKLDQLIVAQPRGWKRGGRGE